MRTLQQQFHDAAEKIKAENLKHKKYSKYINIGGCPYHRTAVLNGHPISIYAATENKLSIKRHSDNENNQEWIELDNAELVIYEKGEMIPAYRYPKLN